MSRLFYHVMQDNVGNLLFDVSGTMRVAGTGTLATIYGDEALTVILPNPMTNHPSFGSFKCFLGAGDYDFYMAKAGYTFETLTGVQGHGTMAQQDANAVAITGGTATLGGVLVPERAGSGVLGYQTFINEAGGTNRWAFYGGGDAPSQMGGRLTVAQSLTARANVLVEGGSGGVRWQNVGSDIGGGYSSAIALGWNGTLQARVDGTAIGTITVTPSDARVKQEVQADVPGLAAVQALRPVSFVYDQTARPIGFAPGRRYGLVAQEAQAQVPYAVTDDGSGTGLLGIEYAALIPVLVHSVQELAQQVQALTAQVATLTAR